MTEKGEQYTIIESRTRVKQGNKVYTVEQIINKLEHYEERIQELNRINHMCEEQINELRRLVNIATHFIKDSKKEEWKKELLRE